MTRREDASEPRRRRSAARPTARSGGEPGSGARTRARRTAPSAGEPEPGSDFLSRALPAAKIAALRRDLCAWYDRARRDLPWRRTRDPYRVWLSETMLQQTRVQTVIPYYERFLERFPDVSALADADEDDVLREWAGLGYYSRARNLHRAAQQVVRDHGGELPSDPGALRALPGVGSYTAGAIRSIVFDQPAPIVDGNVRRVLARWLAAEELSEREQWAAAEALVPSARPGDFNQALMELGATVCMPRSPTCLLCPVREHCAASTSADPERFPAPRRRAAQQPVEAVAGLLQIGRSLERVLLARRPRGGLLGGLWELPSLEGSDPAELSRELEARSGLATRPGDALGALEHGFSHRLLTLRLFRLELADPRRTRLRAPPDQVRWFARAELGELAHSRLMAKALVLAGLAPAAR